MVPAVEDSVAAVARVHTLVPAGAGKLIGCTGKLLRWPKKNPILLLLLLLSAKSHTDDVNGPTFPGFFLLTWENSRA